MRSSTRIARIGVGVMLIIGGGPVAAQARGAAPAGTDAGLLGAAHAIRLDSATIAAAPARTLAEVLAGRVPGLNVTWASGDAGLAPELNVRGSATFFGPGRPLLYVDGVLQREDRHVLGPALDRQRPSHAWSLPASEIAEVEVVLGPAGGALLPFGAPRGAVFVRTRRGGGDRWRTSALLEFSHQAETAPFRTRVTQAGDIVGGGTTPYCPRTDVATGYCTTTGERVFVPFGGRTPFTASTGLRAGVAASGATPVAALRLAALTDRSPRLTRADGFDRLDLSLNADARRWRGLQASLDARYARSEGAYVAWGENGVHQLGVAGNPPDDPTVPLILRQVDTLLAHALPYATERVGGGLRLRWSPARWLSAWADGSTERSTRGSDRTINVYDPAPSGGLVGSARQVTTYRVGTGAGSLGVTGTRRLPLGLTARASVGLHRTHTDLGERRVDRATTTSGSASETVQVFDPGLRSTAHFGLLHLDAGEGRWIAGGFRKEATRMLGRTFGDDPFNQLQAGWTLSRERWMPALPGIARVHLRFAYGESGDHEAVFSAVRVGLPTAGGAVRARLQRTIEREGGADLDLLGGRLRLGGTAFTRALRDGYLPTNSGIPGNALAFASWVTHGHEWTLTLPSRAIGSVTIASTLGWSSARTRITRFPYPGSPSTLVGQSRVTFTEGERFGALLAARYYFTDANADGTIDATEITIGVPSPAGVTTPTDLFAADLRASWRDAVTLGVTLDGKSGHQRYDGTARAACLLLVCPGLYDGALATQARAVASGYSSTFTGPLTAGDFVRARAAWVRVRLRALAPAAPDAALTLALQNAVLWRRAGRGDPETGTFAFATVQRGNFLVPGLAPQLSLRLEVVR